MQIGEGDSTGYVRREKREPDNEDIVRHEKIRKGNTRERVEAEPADWKDDPNATRLSPLHVQGTDPTQ